jgi:hypothetical protein
MARPALLQPAAPFILLVWQGDPDNSLKEAGEILKARTTIYLWYRNGEFPPA